MKAVNALLQRTVVENEEDVKDSTAAEYLIQVKRTRDLVAHGPDLLVDPKAKRGCSVCRQGVYEETFPGRACLAGSGMPILAFYCTHCGHIQTFLKGVAMWEGLGG